MVPDEGRGGMHLMGVGEEGGEMCLMCWEGERREEGCRRGMWEKREEGCWWDREEGREGRRDASDGAGKGREE
jgi:hypothetical protein